MLESVVIVESLVYVVPVLLMVVSSERVVARISTKKSPIIAFLMLNIDVFLVFISFF